MALVDDLSWRGLIHQTTAENLGETLRAPTTIYVGFDPSAPSLHVGSLMPLTGMAHFRRHGHQVIALVGGATGMIGDPSGKTSERKLLAANETATNAGRLEAQMRTFFERGDDAERAGPPVRFVNNLDWFGSMSVLEFLRDVGKHFSVNQMIQRDSIRERFETREAGISFTEFSYMLLQGYDFYELYRRQGCRLQCGASDQWGNIVSGADLVRRLAGDTVHGLTFPLVLDAQGKKFGKTEKGAVYLDAAMTSAYDFYQFWLNVTDADVGRFLRWLTFLAREEIEALEALPPEARRPQQALAAKLTERVHGKVALQEAIAATKRLFRVGGDVYGEDKTVALTGAEAKGSPGSVLPGITLPATRFEGAGVLLVDLLVELGACPSKSDARRQLEQGGISVNGKALGPVGPDVRIATADLLEGQVVIQRGKKHRYVVRVA